MALYAIGDLHLSLTADKPMEVFGPAWENYTERIGDALSRLTAGDVLVLAGDTSWGIDLNEAEADFRFLDQFPCKKYLVKGNHDYWWSTAAKAERFFADNGIKTIEILNNNCRWYGDIALCGTRGWFYEEERGGEHDKKIMLRELGRLETSLKCAGESEKLVFLHYPPKYAGYECPELLALLEKYKDTQPFKPFLIYALADEPFSLAVSSEAPEGMEPRYFFFGQTLLLYVYWCGLTALGSVLGKIITFDTTGLDFALNALFIVFFLQQWKDRSKRPACVIGVAVTLLARIAFGPTMFLIPALVSMLLVFWLGRDKL